MSFIKADLTELLSFVDKLKTVPAGLSKYMESGKVAESMKELLLREAKDSLSRVGIVSWTHHLKRSFKFVGIESSGGVTTYRVVNTARYASYLDMGVAPSAGRYVPALGKRLVNASAMGMHPGNKPYRFVDDAEAMIAKKAPAKLSRSCTSWLKKFLGKFGE